MSFDGTCSAESHCFDTPAARPWRNAAPTAAQPFVRSYPAVPRSVRDARQAAERAVRGWGLATGQVEDVGLVVSELATNSQEHAHPTCRTAGFRITISLHGHAVRVDVWDASPALPQRRQPDPDAEAGRGLNIVETLAAECGYRRQAEGKTVFAIIGP